MQKWRKSDSFKISRGRFLVSAKMPQHQMLSARELLLLVWNLKILLYFKQNAVELLSGVSFFKCYFQVNGMVFKIFAKSCVSFYLLLFNIDFLSRYSCTSCSCLRCLTSTSDPRCSATLRCEKEDSLLKKYNNYSFAEFRYRTLPPTNRRQEGKKNIQKHRNRKSHSLLNCD